MYISCDSVGLLCKWAVGLWKGLGAVFVVVVFNGIGLRRLMGCVRDEYLCGGYMRGCVYDVDYIDNTIIIIIFEYHNCYDYYWPTPPPHAQPNSTYSNSSDENDYYHEQYSNHYYFDYHHK